LIRKPYDFEPKSLGGHIRKRRLQLGQMQREAAIEMGVNSWTVVNWEKGNTEPVIASMPAIFKYLGYNPFPTPKTLPEHMLAKRQEMGWSIKEAAEWLGVDPGAWGNWERGKLVLYRIHRARLASYLGVSRNVINSEMLGRWSRAHERDTGTFHPRADSGKSTQ
jgi:DNA-binding XRE family transcriptional regulator